MTNRTRTTETLIRRAIAAAQSSGLDVGAVRVGPGGTVEIIAKDAVNPLGSRPGGSDTCDDIFQRGASA